MGTYCTFPCVTLVCCEHRNQPEVLVTDEQSDAADYLCHENKDTTKMYLCSERKTEHTMTDIKCDAANLLLIKLHIKMWFSLFVVILHFSTHNLKYLVSWIFAGHKSVWCYYFDIVDPRVKADKPPTVKIYPNQREVGGSQSSSGPAAESVLRSSNSIKQTLQG